MPIYFLLIFAIIYLVIKEVWYADGGGVPFVPADDDAIERIMKLADVGEGDVFYELGSGDGRLVIAAAMKGAESYGIEINPLRAFYSSLWCKILRLNNAHIIRGDYNNVDLSGATIVTTYLLPEKNNELRSKLKRELKKDTKVLALGFEFKGWNTIKKNNNGVYYGPLHLYVID